jgi:hypothetical protein
LDIQTDPNIQQMLYFYNEMCNFYESLIPEVLGHRQHGGPVAGSSASAMVRDEVDGSALRNVFRDNLVDLLGSPMVHMNLSWNSNVGHSVMKKDAEIAKPLVKSEARLIAEKIMQLLSEVNLDTNHFLNWAGRYNQIHAAVQTEEDPDNTEDIIEPQLISVASYMYLLYGEKLTANQLPSITYSPSYIFSSNLHLIHEFLFASVDNDAFLLKGLGLARGIIELVNSASLFTAETFSKVQSVILDRVG